MVKKIINWIKNIRIIKKQKEKEENLKIIRNRFYLMDYNDSIYIMCNHTAIYKAKPNQTISEIINFLKETRNTALEYKNFQL